MRKAWIVLASVVLLDLALRWPAADGVVLGHPLPPFGRAPAQEPAAGAAGDEGGGRFDAELGWTWRPDTRDAEGRTIGPGGARGPRTYAHDPPAGVLRVLTFGDSFVFGDEIPDRSTFQAILEARRRSWEVVNFGVSGYGTDQALLRMRRQAPGRGARVIAMGLLLENIGRNVNRYRPLWNPSTGFRATKPRFVLESGALRLVPQPFEDAAALAEAVRGGAVLERVREHEHWLERPPVPLGGASTLARLAAAALAYRARSIPRLWSEPEGEPFRVTLALLEAFSREARELGAELAPILIFPAASDLERALAGERYWEPLLAELDRRGLEHLDLIDVLAGDARARGIEDVETAYYYGYHLSSAGNALVASALEAWIEARLDGGGAERPGEDG